MSWQVEYERCYLQKLSKDWRPDGTKISRTRHWVTFDDLPREAIEESRLKMEECFNEPSPLGGLFKENK